MDKVHDPKNDGKPILIDIYNDPHSPWRGEKPGDLTAKSSDFRMDDPLLGGKNIPDNIFPLHGKFDPNSSFMNPDLLKEMQPGFDKHPMMPYQYTPQEKGPGFGKTHRKPKRTKAPL